VLCDKARVIAHQAHGGALVVYYLQASDTPFLPLGSSKARPKALQAPLYARHRLPRPLLCSKPSSRLSKRSTNSNCSFSFVSTLMARR
jgi:hypothetical protein